MSSPFQAKRWVFTLNNPTDDEQFLLYALGESIAADGDESECSYLIFGDETGANGTPHLQGYLCLRKKKRLQNLKEVPGLQRAHLEVARGSHAQASDYCKKDGSYHEWGSAPNAPGNGSKFVQLRDWVASQETIPTIEDVWEVFPDLAARYRSACLECIAIFGNRPSLVEPGFELRDWQRTLDEVVNQEPDDRTVICVVDERGGMGKSKLAKYWMSNRPGTQCLSIGRRDDLAYKIDVKNNLFVFDIPRGNLQFFQYNVAEMLKDRIVHSNKYQPVTKYMNHNCHVVVFTNEQPDREALSADRWDVRNLLTL